jgi:hypothetical protein
MNGAFLENGIVRGVIWLFGYLDIMIPPHQLRLLHLKNNSNNLKINIDNCDKIWYSVPNEDG